MPAYAPSVKSGAASSKSKFTPTEDYERRVIKTVKNEAERLGDILAGAALVVEKQMGYVEPAVPYPPHTFGQTVDYTLNYTTNAISDIVEHANTDACHVIDDIRQEIAHYDENAEKRKEQEEKDMIKKDKADRAEASKEAFKRKMMKAFQKEQVKAKELVDKVIEKVADNEAKRREFDNQVVESLDKFGKKIVETFEGTVKNSEAKVQEFDHQILESMDQFGKKVVEAIEKADASHQTKITENTEALPTEPSTHKKKKVDFSHHDKEISPTDDLAHGKKTKSSRRHDRKSKSKDITPTEDSTRKENAKSVEIEPTPSQAPNEDIVSEASTPAVEVPMQSEDLKDSKPSRPANSRSGSSFGKLAYFLGLDKKNRQKPAEVEEEPVSSDSAAEPVSEPVVPKEDSQEAEPCCTCPSSNEHPEDACGSSKATKVNAKQDVDQCSVCPSDSEVCCETPSKADPIDERKEASTCNTCIEGALAEASKAEPLDEDCSACPPESANKCSPKTAEPSDEDCSACPPESANKCTPKTAEPYDDSCFACPSESANKGSAKAVAPEVAVEEAPMTEATSTEVFHHLTGSKGDDVATMVFNDSRVQALNPPKQFTVHANGDQSCLVHEGNSESNPALGYIKLSWNRMSRGPVFILGEPYFEATATSHRKSTKSPRGYFSSYSAEKNKKPERFFSFTFPQRSDAKKSSPKEYTWRAAPRMDPESDGQEIELRKGGKRNFEGALVAAWKLDVESGEQILSYKQPSVEEVDESVMDKWMAALLLTAYCAMKHGLGEKETVSA